VGALVSGLPRRNGWTIAEHAGDRSPDRTQRLLNRASWDTFAAMSQVRRFAVGAWRRRRGGAAAGAGRSRAADRPGAVPPGYAVGLPSVGLPRRRVMVDAARPFPVRARAAPLN